MPSSSSTLTVMMIVKVMKTYLSCARKGLFPQKLQKYLLSQCSDPMCSLCRAKHDPGSASNSESAIKEHAESIDHNFHPRDVRILKHSMTNYLLELWHSTLDSASIREKNLLTHAYLQLIKKKINKTKANGLAAQAITNPKIAALKRVDRSHQKLRTEKRIDRIAKKRISITDCNTQEAVFSVKLLEVDGLTSR